MKLTTIFMLLIAFVSNFVLANGPNPPDPGNLTGGPGGNPTPIDMFSYVLLGLGIAISLVVFFYLNSKKEITLKNK